MAKKYFLACVDCGYRKDISASEVYDREPCPICSGEMNTQTIEESKTVESTGYDFSKVDRNKIKEIRKENKQNPLTDTERLMINSLAQEIKDFGEERVWNNLNTMVLDKRFDYIEFFLSALNLLKVGEY